MALQTSTYKVTIAGFDPHEEPASEYPEDSNFLRFWHPLYEDFVDVGPRRMAEAKARRCGDDPAIVEIIEFRRPRKSFDGKEAVGIPDYALFGISMYCRTRNSVGQQCIKPNGTAVPSVLLWDVHDSSGFEYTGLRFISHQLHAESRGRDPSMRTAEKARIRNIKIEALSSGRFAYQRFETKNHLAKDFGLFQSTMKRIINESYKPTFTMSNRPHPPKLRGYYSPRYMSNGGEVYPISAYMIRTSSQDAVRPDVKMLQMAFDIVLHQKPEMEGRDEFTLVARKYLDSESDDPSGGDADLRRKWFTCVEIAIAMTCVYNNAVPYLMDMEHARQAVGTNMRSNALNPHAELGNHKDWVEVERMVDAEKDYGHDCEDSSMNADFRKRTLDFGRLKADGLWDQLSEELQLISQICELFVAVVPQMFCGGNDAQTMKDDGIFHFSALFIPRVYFARMEANARTPADFRRPFGESSVRGWEKHYKVGYGRDGVPRGHIGVMYGEGTNTVCPSQFSYDVVVDEARRDAQSFMSHCATALSNVEETVNIYHDNVYAKSRAHLSSFYKHVMACLCGDGPHHRKKGVYDYLFTVTTEPGTYGVPVEYLALGDDRVALKAIMTYTQEEMEAIETVLTFRSMAYGVVRPPASLDPPMSVACGVSGIEERNIAINKNGIPHFRPETPIDRYRYIRFAPLDVDLQDPKRATKLLTALRKVVHENKMQITGVKVYGHVLQATPMDPVYMDGVSGLRVIDILIFYQPTLMSSVQKQIRDMLSL